MSDHSISFDDSFDDSFEELLSQTVVKNEDIFEKLFSNNFEDESILTELSTDESLPQIILNFENYCNRDNRSNDLFFDYILGLNNLMQKLSQIEDEIIELWICSPKQRQNCILSTILKFLPNCYTQLCSSKTVDLFKFAPNLRISFYESIAFNICQLMITLTKTQFQSVEPLFIKLLLSEQSVCSLLASDVLCFVARLSKSPICYHFCSVLMTVSPHINDSKLPNISSLINRLIPFLKDIELEYLLKDYDLFTHSRVWRIPNIFCLLSSQQIKECFDKFKNLIESGKPLTKYNIEVLRYLLMTDELDDKSREYWFQLFWNNFLTQTDPNFYGNFIDLLTIVLPNQLNDTFIETTFEKLCQIPKQSDKIALDLSFIEKVLIFFTRLSFIDVSDQMNKQMTQMISPYIIFIYKNSDTFYAKYLVFKTLEEISLKSKLISIVDNCCKISDFREEFVSYLQKIKTSQVMDETEKIDYLQTIESNLRTQTDFKTNEVIEENDYYMEKEETVCVEDDHKSNGVIPIEVDSGERLADKLIAFFEANVRKNESFIKSNPKRGLSLISDEFNDFIKKLKVKY